MTSFTYSSEIEVNLLWAQKTRKKTKNMAAPERINVRFKVGVLQLSDVEQSIRADFNCFFYYDPVEPVDFKGGQHVRFENIETPPFIPAFDFENEVETALVTDESYWLDTETGRVFGRYNWIPHIQQRFNHKPFPFDRQILDIKCLLNNCQVEKWSLEDEDEYPVELSMDHSEWVSSVELNAVADSWDLRRLETHCLNDEVNKSATVHFQVFLDREHRYFYWNVAVVYFLIISMMTVLVAFPYSEARFDFSLTLALTTVAFKWVTSELVPKTSYLTYLDKFMLIGLGLLLLRVFADFTLQLSYVDILPKGDNAERIKCDETNELSSGMTVCDVDIACTVVLSSLWVISFMVMTLFTLFPNIIRPKWNNLNSRHGRNKYMEYEITGNTSWTVDDVNEIKSRKNLGKQMVAKVEDTDGTV